MARAMKGFSIGLFYRFVAEGYAPSSLGSDRLADPGITGLDCRIDEIQAFFVWQEGALHPVDRDSLEVVEGQAKSIRGRFKFLAHRRVAHQPVVSVQSDAKFLPIKNPERMLRQTRRGAGVNIAEQANLEGNALVQNVLRQITQLHCLPVGYGDIVDQPRPVPDAMRSAILN